MRLKTLLCFAFALFVTRAGADQAVSIGLNGANTFSPNQLTANVGETIHFSILSGKHDVQQGSLSSPCTPDPAPYNGSSVLPAGGWFSLWVGFTSPAILLFSTSACADGMVMVINPQDPDTLDAYVSAATGGKGPSNQTNTVADPAETPGGATGTPGGTTTPSAGSTVPSMKWLWAATAVGTMIVIRNLL